MSEGTRATLQLTERADEIATQLKASLGFDDKADVARLALGYAVASGISPQRDAEGLGPLKGTTYGIRTLDREGEMEGLFRALHPDYREDVGEAFHVLVNRGLEALADQPTPYSISELLATLLASIEAGSAPASP